MSAIRHYEHIGGRIFVCTMQRNLNGEFSLIDIQTGSLYASRENISEFKDLCGINPVRGTVKFEKPPIRIKKASEIVKILEDNEYKVDAYGNWSPKEISANKIVFTVKMFQLCGKSFDHSSIEKSDINIGYILCIDGFVYSILPEWIEFDC